MNISVVMPSGELLSDIVVHEGTRLDLRRATNQRPRLDLTRLIDATDQYQGQQYQYQGQQYQGQQYYQNHWQ